jgi:uncharacterized protein YkwD
MRILCTIVTLLLFGVATANASVEHELEQRIFNAMNHERTSHGLRPLLWSEPLAQQARRHSKRMAEKHFFAHEDPEFGDASKRLTRAGIKWRAVAENLYEESGLHDPAREAVKAWMRSPGHRANLLGKVYTHAGVGVAAWGKRGFVVTAIFAAF